MEEIQPEAQWTIVSVATVAGGILITWLRSAVKWVGHKLLDSKEGLITRWFERQCEMMEAVSGMPIVMQAISDQSQKDAATLERIEESQVGDNSHPKVLHDKFNLMIEAKIRFHDAFRAYLDEDREKAEACLDEVVELLNRAKSL